MEKLFSILQIGEKFLLPNDDKIYMRVEINKGNAGPKMLVTRPLNGYIDDNLTVTLTMSDFLVLSLG